MSKPTLDAILAREERLHPKPKAKVPKKTPKTKEETPYEPIEWPTT